MLDKAKALIMKAIVAKKFYGDIGYTTILIHFIKDSLVLYLLV